MFQIAAFARDEAVGDADAMAAANELLGQMLVSGSFDDLGVDLLARHDAAVEDLADEIAQPFELG